MWSRIRGQVLKVLVPATGQRLSTPRRQIMGLGFHNHVEHEDEHDKTHRLSHRARTSDRFNAKLKLDLVAIDGWLQIKRQVPGWGWQRAIEIKLDCP
jgi:hypothetical protein